MVDESENIFDTCVPTASNLAIINNYQRDFNFTWWINKNNTKYYFHRATSVQYVWSSKVSDDYFTDIYLTKEVPVRKCGTRYAKYSFHWFGVKRVMGKLEICVNRLARNFNEFWNESTVGGSEWATFRLVTGVSRERKICGFCGRSMETRMKFVRAARRDFSISYENLSERNQLIPRVNSKRFFPFPLNFPLKKSERNI